MDQKAESVIKECHHVPSVLQVSTGKRWRVRGGAICWFRDAQQCPLHTAMLIMRTAISVMSDGSEGVTLLIVALMVDQREIEE